MRKNPAVNPVVVINACRRHRPRRNRVVETGPGITEDQLDRIESVLRCWRCWESDETNIRQFLSAIGTSAEEVEKVYSAAFAKKPY